MSRRQIGIDYDGAVLRVAVAIRDRGRTTLTSLHRCDCPAPEELPAAVAGLVGGFRHGDTAAAALPAAAGFVRWLELPFAEPRKIEAALPFELSAQLPVAGEECVTAFRQRAGRPVLAAAARRDTVLPLLERCDGAALPLHVLDLAPFACAPLPGPGAEGVLACVSRRETTVALLTEGEVVAYRLLPGGAERGTEETARFILDESARLRRGNGELPLSVLGAGVDEPLLAALRAEDPSAAVPHLALDGRPLPAGDLPAAALALQPGAGVNFRRGPLALKSEWAAMRKQLVTAASLLGLAFLALAGSAYLARAERAGRAEALKKELAVIYRETFPGSSAIVDVPLQMQSALRELRKQGERIGVDRRGGALASLREVSGSLPADLPVDVREFSYEGDTVRLAGHTTSFDAVNRMARGLEASPLFAAAQVAEAKMSLDGDRVDFRIQLSLSPGGER